MKHSIIFNDVSVSYKKGHLFVKKLVKLYLSKSFAIPTVLMASIIMLTVLVFTISSIVAVHVASRGQYYGQLAKTASDSGLVYALGCLNANNDAPLAGWTDSTPLKPNTDCNGVAQIDCTNLTNLTTDNRCSITKSVGGSNRFATTFSVPRPTLNADGKAVGLISNGSTNLLRSSDNSIWRTYSQSARFSRYFPSPLPPVNFSTTGNFTSTVPAGATTVKIEVWGAQGEGTSGLGGYSNGNLVVATGKVLGVYVGGSGVTGGYNGGESSSGYGGARGGGASDVRYDGTTTAATLLSARKIVAGGGGGGYDTYGGVGGGSAGTQGGSFVPCGSGGGMGGMGGTQTTGSSLGYGGASGLPNANNEEYAGSGGGGGYWGGYAGDTCFDGSPGGGGGSGYIGGVTSGTTIAGNLPFPATGGGTETGHVGNGYVRLTYSSAPVVYYF